MIVKMSKYAFMVYHKEYEQFLDVLRDVGVVHIKETQPATDSLDMQEIAAERKRLGNIMSLFKNLSEDDQKAAKLSRVREIDRAKGLKLVKKVESLVERRTVMQADKQTLQKDINYMELWGNFSYTNIRKLKESGYEVTFYTCPASRFEQRWVDEYNAIQINTVQSVIYFVTVTATGSPVEIDAERPKMPNRGLEKLRVRYQQLQVNIKHLETELEKCLINCQNTFEVYDKLLLDEWALENVHIQTSSGADDKLMLLEGWAPTCKEKDMEATLGKSGYFCRKLALSPDDDVPVRFTNNLFARLFEPISKLYMLPKYNELDLTPFFAPFFMLFFGLCLGDSGYGLLLLIVATAVKLVKSKKLQPSMKSILSLVQVLGTSTLLCGFLTGTFFGSDMYDWGIPALDTLKEKVFMDNNKMFNLSLILGVIQIIFGMSLKAVNRIIQFGFKYGLSTIGWITLLLSIIFAVLFPSVMPLFGTVHLVIASLSGVLIFFFNSPKDNVFLNVGLGIWDTYNMATGLLGDVLSYVRLFALGLSGGILAGVFNSLAKGMSPDNVILGPVVMVLILLVGHGLNIFMNVLGAIVHPMRLTFVEFFKNSGYEGGGSAYNPFKRNN